MGPAWGHTPALLLASSLTLGTFLHLSMPQTRLPIYKMWIQYRPSWDCWRGKLVPVIHAKPPERGRAQAELASMTAKILIPSFWVGTMKSASLTHSPDDSNPVRNTGMKSTTILPLSLWPQSYLPVGRLEHQKLSKRDHKASSSVPFHPAESPQPSPTTGRASPGHIPHQVGQKACSSALYRQVWVVQGGKVGPLFLARESYCPPSEVVEGWGEFCVPGDN